MTAPESAVMSLTPFDFAVIAVILISAILAMVRGFVREVLSIASWLIAAVAAYYLYEPLRGLIQPYIESEQLATIVSVAVIFIVVLVIATYVTVKIADVVIDSRVGSIDRIFGFAFGAVRGALLVVVAYALFVWLVEDQPAWIADAESRPLLVDLSERLIAVLPDDIEAELQARLRGEELPEDPTPPEPIPAEGGGNLDGDRIEQIINGNAAGAGSGPLPPAP
jgi:membrane protein required for colicin V production